MLEENKARPGNQNAVKSGVHSSPLVILQCRHCCAADVCPKVLEAQAEFEGRCYYEMTEEVPDLQTAQGILDLLESKTRMEWRRYKRAERANIARGKDFVDREMTTLSNSVTKDLVTLAELGTRFGIIKVDPEANPTQNGPVIHAEQVNLVNITQEAAEKCLELHQRLQDLQQTNVVPLLQRAKIPVKP